MDFIDKIICGDALEVLKQIPSDSVDCIITSPPYWNMRDYGEATCKVWGGDPDCEHEWETIETKRPNASGGKTDFVKEKFNIKGKENFREFVDYHNRVTRSSFCKKCGAWCGQLGLEPTLDMYIEHLLEITAELKRILKPTGVLWWNHGDCYGGSGKGRGNGDWIKKSKNLYYDGLHPPPIKGITPKCMVLQNYRLILRMVDEQGWILRNIIIWYKPNHMPSSVKDRFTNAYEPVFMLTKSKKYWFDLDAVRLPHKTEPQDDYCKAVGKSLGKNPGDLWEIPTQPFPEAHFACVDEETECLTMFGWKKWNELKKGEIIASFDLKSGKLRWERLEDIYVYDYDGYLIEIANLSLGFRFTPNHRMVCQSWRAKTKRWSEYYIKELKDVTSYDCFPVAGEWEEGSFGLDPYEPSPDMCELLGWICSEGNYRKYGLNIYQSLTKNPDKVARIEYLLQKLGIRYKKHIRNRKYKGRPYQGIHFSIKWEDGVNKIKMIIPEKKPTWNMILWSKEGIKRFLQGFIGGDGCVRENSERIQIDQKDKETLDILQAMAFRLGYRAILSWRKHRQLWDLFLSRKLRSSARKTNGKGLNLKKVYYKGKIWCPRTPSTTFVARRNGRIIICGNTFPEKLVEPMVKASCPQWVCKKCGKARARIVKRIGGPTGDHTKYGKDSSTLAVEATGKRHFASGTTLSERYKKYGYPEYVTVGWTDCGCGAGWDSGIVLDPFAGSGTTCLVAKKLGRHYIGIELNPEYVKMAKKRINFGERLEKFGVTFE